MLPIPPSFKDIQEVFVAEEKAAGEGVKRKVPKGRHLSAIKRHRQSVKRHERNTTMISATRTAMKRVVQAVEKKDAALAKTLLKKAMSHLNKAAAKGIIHSGHASRHIGRLSLMVARLAQ